MSAGGGGDADSIAPAAPQVGSVSVTLPASALQGGATLSAAAEVKSTSEVVLTAASTTLITERTSQATATRRDERGATLTGRTATLPASVLDASGNTLPNLSVGWGSSNTAVAGVSQSGVVTAIAPGVATITASGGGRTGSARETVHSVAAVSIALDVASLTITVGDVRLVRATVSGALQNVLRGSDVTWTTSNRQVVDGQVLGGSVLITGVGSGSAMVTATVEERTVSLLVSVVAGGQSVCSALDEAVVYGDDGQYLGRFTNPFDSQSILNEFGAYGSPYRSTSTTNESGTYGSPHSALSARNPCACRPPSIFKNGRFLAYYTVNTAKSPRVNPVVALLCIFP